MSSQESHGGGQGGSGRSDWRGRGQRRQPAGRATPERDWARRRGHGAERRVWAFRSKVASGLLVAGALVGVLIWWLISPGQTPLLSAVLVEYEFPVPHNAWAGDDLHNLRDTLGAKSSADHPLSVAERPPVAFSQTRTRQAWIEALRSQIDAVAGMPWWHLDRGPGKGAVIVYLSGHGVVDQEGRPCLLLPSDSAADDPLRPDNLVPIQALLSELFQDGDKPRLPEASTKLVVLDAMRFDACWELGVLYNHFADKLAQTIDQIPISNLYVLTPAAAGQINWGSHELGGSVFGFYFRRALQGHADQEGFGNNDRRVSVAELHGYVQRKVGAWVERYRGDEQTPLLLASARAKNPQADLVFYGQAVLRLPDPLAPGLETEERRLAELRRRFWDQHERLFEPAIRYHPASWHEYQARLLWLEQAALAGPRTFDDARFDAAVRQLDQLRSRIAQVDLPGLNTAPNGLHLAAALAPERFSTSAAPRLREQGAAEQKVRDALASGAWSDELLDIPYPVRARAAWDWLVDEPTAERLQQVVTRVLPLGGAQWQAESEPIEIHFARMLHHYLDRGVLADRADLVARAIRLRDRAERLAAGLPGPSRNLSANRRDNAAADPGAAAAVAPAAGTPADGRHLDLPDERIAYRVAPLRETGDHQRRLGEDLMFVGRPEALQRAESHFAAAEQAYALAEQHARVLADAYRLRDRALAELPAMAEYFARRRSALDKSPAGADQRLAAIGELARGVEALLLKLEQAPDGELTSDALLALDAATGRLRQQLDLEREELRSRMQRIIAGRSDDDPRHVLDALATPILTDKGRGDLHLTFLHLCRRYAFRDDLNLAEQSGSPVRRRWEQITGWPEHPALALVGMARDEFRAADGRLDAMRAELALRGRLAALRARDAAAVRLDLELYAPRDLHESAPPTRRALAEAESADRRQAALVRTAPHAGQTPTEQLRRYDLARLLVAQAQRTLDDFWGPPPGTGGRPFFEDAAHRSLVLARALGDTAMSETAIERRIRARVAAAGDGLSVAFKPDDRMIRFRRDQQGTDPTTTAPHSVQIRHGGGDLPLGTAAYNLVSSAAFAAPSTIRGMDQAPDAPPARLPHPVDGQEREEEHAYRILDLKAQHLAGIVFFRGNLFSDPVKAVVEIVDYACQRTMRLAGPEQPKPVVEVEPPQRKLAVLIVLDCSRSMEAQDVPGADGRPNQQRWQVATRVVSRILSDLKQSKGDIQVGLRLYGHRVIYARDGNLQWVDGNAVAGVRPPADTELVVGIGPIRDTADLIERRIRAAKPWGFTPLYLSIKKAVEEDFAAIERRADARDIQRKVIVVTDGVNLVPTNDAEIGDDVNVIVRRDRLVQAIAGANTRSRAGGLPAIEVDVVGLRVGDDLNPSERQPNAYVGTIADLREASRQGGGAYYDAQNEDDLLRELRLRAGMYFFRLVDRADQPAALENADGTPISDRHVRVGSAVRVPQGQYRIQFSDSRVADAYPLLLRGGERVQLQLTQASRGAKHTVEQFCDLDKLSFDNQQSLADEQRRAMLLRWNPAQRLANGAARFTFSLRYDDTKVFTARPAEVLAVVRPRPDAPGRADRLDAPYAVFDVQYELGVSFPRFSFEIADWPHEDPSEAEIELWIRMAAATRPDAQLRLDDRRSASVPVAQGEAEFRILPPESESDGRHVLTVVEKHPAAAFAAGMDHVRVGIDPNRPAPDEIVRRYYPGDGTVEHTFLFRRQSDLTLQRLEAYAVHLTRRDRVSQEAIATGPIRVRVPAKP